MNSHKPIPEMVGTRRAALYLSEINGAGSGSAALIDCARQAQLMGLRVVTVVAEDHEVLRRVRNDGLGGKRLRSLVEYLKTGQFDVIVAHTGGSMITIGASVQMRQGEVG